MIDFSGFEADRQQQDNVAGLRRMWKVLDKSFVAEYPVKSDIVAGEITVSPTVRMRPYLIPAHYMVPINTAMYSDVLAGARGYQAYRHVVGYQMAGLGKELLAELLKDINSGSVYFLEDTNGNINVAGSSKKGLPINTTGNSGKDGNEQRGKVMASEEVGFRWPVMPLSAAARTAFLNRVENVTFLIMNVQSRFLNFNELVIFNYGPLPSIGAFISAAQVRIRAFTDASFTTQSPQIPVNGIIGNLIAHGETTESGPGSPIVSRSMQVVITTPSIDINNGNGFTGQFIVLELVS
jgi:hypothetical protein